MSAYTHPAGPAPLITAGGDVWTGSGGRQHQLICEAGETLGIKPDDVFQDNGQPLMGAEASAKITALCALVAEMARRIAHLELAPQPPSQP